MGRLGDESEKGGGDGWTVSIASEVTAIPSIHFLPPLLLQIVFVVEIVSVNESQNVVYKVDNHLVQWQMLKVVGRPGIWSEA